MPVGRVKWFASDKGYGFIRPDDGSQEVYVPHSAVRNGSAALYEGAPVAFEFEETQKGPIATMVDELPVAVEQLREDVTSASFEALGDAVIEARKLNNRHVGTTHVLLGLMRDAGLRELLAEHGVDATLVRNALIEIDGPGIGSPKGLLALTGNAKSALQTALDESKGEHATPDRLLSGILGARRGLATLVLRELGVDVDRLATSLGHQAVRRYAERFSQAEVPPGPATGETDPVPSAEATEAVPTHTDRPAVEDRLDRKRLAEVIAERIRRARGEDTETFAQTRAQRREKLRRDQEAARDSGGFLVHVHAPWGAGKSSLLNFLAEDLRNREPDGSATYPNLSQWMVVEFSAWQHQRLVAPWWWLLATVRRGCASELWRIGYGRWAWFWARDLAWRLWNARAAALTVLGLALFVLIAWQLDWFGLPHQSLSTVQTIVLTCGSAIALATTAVGLLRGTSRWLAVGSAEGAVRFLRRAHDPLEVYRNRFHNLVAASGRPLAVLIDDLDRCKPEYVVELLEGIQTLFRDEPVTYVVAADRAWLCQSFAHAYGDFEGTVGEVGRSLGFLFLEKTFQISLRIPPMSSEKRSAFWNELMREDAGPALEDPLESGRRAELSEAFAKASTQAEVEQEVESLRSSNAVEEEAILSAAVRRLNAPQVEGTLKALLEDFAPLLENNPRSMKRIMNAYGFERDRLLRGGHLLTALERKRLVLLTIVRLRWPELADHLERHPDELDYFTGSSSRPQDEDGHAFSNLFDDPALLRVIEGEGIDTALDAESFREFP